MFMFCLAKSRKLVFFSEDDRHPTLYLFTNNGWSLRLLEKTWQLSFFCEKSLPESCSGIHRLQTQGAWQCTQGKNCERFEPRSHFKICSILPPVKIRLSLIVRVNVVLNRTVVVDSDWRVDNLCGSHLQSQRELHHVSWWYYTLVIDLIGQLCRDVIGRLSVKPWCYWLWRLVISNWCVSIRLLSQLKSPLLFVKLSVLQSFSRS